MSIFDARFGIGLLSGAAVTVVALVIVSGHVVKDIALGREPLPCSCLLRKDYP